MFVRDRMSPNPITVTPDTSVSDAMRMMREKKIRRLPVLDHQHQLVGIVSDHDLLYASPSPVTSLSVWEIHDLLYRLTLDKVMTREVITVTEDAPLEEAARIMADHRIGGLPVLRGQTLVGIITETDIFKAFLSQLGGRRPGVRVTVLVPEAKGMLAQVTRAIFSVGGDIVGVGIADPSAASDGLWQITLKVQDVPRQNLLDALSPVVNKIADVREM